MGKSGGWDEGCVIADQKGADRRGMGVGNSFVSTKSEKRARTACPRREATRKRDLPTLALREAVVRGGPTSSTRAERDTAVCILSQDYAARGGRGSFNDQDRGCHVSPGRLLEDGSVGRTNGTQRFAWE